MNEQKLSDIAQRLWDCDMNRVVHGTDYELDLQKSSVRTESGFVDRCDRPLFKYVKDSVLSKQTYQKFIALLDNYVAQTGKQEIVTTQELNEQSAFLDACLNTPVLQEAFKFLVNEKLVSNNIKEFKNLLNSIWFQMYCRNLENRVNDSSAFEHVFIGEKNEEGTIGCHSWIQYYLLEKRKLTDYYGYIPNKCQYSKDKSQPEMITMQFYRDGSVKAVGSFLIGVSPEFEIALYTILYLSGVETVKLNFANMSITFNCYRLNRYGKKVLSTVYPTSVK